MCIYKKILLTRWSLHLDIQVPTNTEEMYMYVHKNMCTIIEHTSAMDSSLFGMPQLFALYNK